VSTLRGRIGLALLVFGLTTLVTMGGAVWLSLRDLHRDAAAGALAELTIPYAVRAGQQIPLEAFRRGGGDGRPASEAIERFRQSQEGRRASGQFIAFVQAAQDEIDAAGISVMLMGDGQVVVRSPVSGQIEMLAEVPDVRLPPVGGEVVTGQTRMAGMGEVLYAATSVRAPRSDRVLPALVLVREDDSAAMATADLLAALALAAMVLLVIGIPLALGLSRSVTRPLHRLASASDAVASGNVPEALPTTGPLEVAEASAAFNAMAAEVGATREAQRQLLADLRHDLRTPLTVIGGFSQALRDGTASGQDAVHAADAISDEAARLGRMLDDLDHLAIPGGSGPPLRLETIDGLEAAANAVERFRPEAERRQQVLTLAEGARSTTLTADRDALDRILGNIIANALEHAPSPGGHIVIEVDRSHGGITVAVRDDGPGIPTAALRQVFDRFYRADPSRTSRGSGLGLAIVRDLAVALGGEAFAENTGSGARVGVTFPATAPAPDGRSPAS
jgi:two-component system, OmpR family, sensor kinase